MTPERKDEIRARCEAATEGPWGWDVNLKYYGMELESRKRGGNIVLSATRWGMSCGAFRFNVDGIMVRADDDSLAKVIPGREHHAGWAREIRHPDADFIAYARLDLPEAMNEIDRLESIPKLDAKIDRIQVAMIKRLETENERLEAEVKHLESVIQRMYR